MIVLFLLDVWIFWGRISCTHGQYIGSPARFEARPPSCGLVNEPLPNDSLLKLMTGNVNSVWLNIQRKSIGGWYWLDNSFYATRISAPEWHKPGMDCGVLRAKDEIIDDTFCNNTYNYYMCQSNGPTCPIAGSYKCFNYNSNSFQRTYFIMSHKGNWYQAVENCARVGTLAVIPESHKTDILKKIAAETITWADIWLGLRQKQYQTPLDPTTSYLQKYDWGDNVCACPEKQCVIATKVGGKVYWKQDLCSSVHPHICEGTADNKENKTKPTYSTPLMLNINGKSTSITAIPGSGLPRSLIIITAVAACVVILVIIASIIVFLYFWRKRNQDMSEQNVEKGSINRRQTPIDMKDNEAEEKELLSKETNRAADTSLQNEEQVKKSDEIPPDQSKSQGPRQNHPIRDTASHQSRKPKHRQPWEVLTWQETKDKLIPFLYEHKSDVINENESATLLDRFLCYLNDEDATKNFGLEIESVGDIKYKLAEWYTRHQPEDTAKKKLYEIITDPNMEFAGLYDSVYK